MLFSMRLDHSSAVKIATGNGHLIFITQISKLKQWILYRKQLPCGHYMLKAIAPFLKMGLTIQIVRTYHEEDD